jgi:hypothetical protein
MGRVRRPRMGVATDETKVNRDEVDRGAEQRSVFEIGDTDSPSERQGRRRPYL